MKKIAIIMGSDSDLPIMKDAAIMLEELNISYEIKVLSAHRTPAAAVEYASSLDERGTEIIIAGAGKAAHLAGVLAAHTIKPVIGVPIRTSTLGGADALYSTVQMPGGIPVATVALNGAKNAAILAAEILALKDEKLKKKIEMLRKESRDKISNINQRLEKIGWDRYLEEVN